MSAVAALFTCTDSAYAGMADCFDVVRDARTFDLSMPVVAHPPCRAWCNLSHFAKPRADERDLAWWSMHVVRHCGGVLEHPITSKLWREAGCGTPGVRDRFGGVLVTVLQRWFGHRSPKATGLYIVGADVPELPDVHRVVANSISVQNMSQAGRMRTPPELAAWLVSVARAAA